MSYGTFAEFYDVLTDNVGYKKRAKVINSLIEKYSSPKDEKPILLDLACGTGSLSFEFEDFGFDVIGTDLSEDMLSVAMEKKLELDSSAIFLRQDMRELNMFGTIDVAICALDSLNHLTEFSDLEKVFDRVSLFLNKDALFIFDVNTIYKHKEILSDNTFVYDCDEVYLVWQNSTCDEDGKIEINLDFFIPEEQSEDEEDTAYFRESESFFERAYSHEAICELLSKNGFELLERLDGDSFEGISEKSQRALYVARLKKFRNG